MDGGNADNAAPADQSGFETATGEHIMKTNATIMDKDTFFGAGLIAVTIAWVALAAVRGPQAPDAAGAIAPAMATHQPATHGVPELAVYPADASRHPRAA